MSARAPYGAAAYTWAQQLEIDVVIVAIEEPVARSLRTVEALSSGTQSWPVVAISSRGDRDTMRKAMISGVRDFLVQPVNAEELRQTVVNVRHVDRARKATSGEAGLSHPLGTVIAVAGFKGGIGKSAISSNIAVGSRPADAAACRPDRSRSAVWRRRSDAGCDSQRDDRGCGR